MSTSSLGLPDGRDFQRQNLRNAARCQLIKVAGLTITKAIREQLTLMLDEVPFDKEDSMLLPEAGPCTTCPKRTGFNQALWDHFKEDRCLDAECYNGKLKEHIARQIQSNSNLIQISAYYSTTDKNTLTRDRYTVIEQPKEGTEPSRAAQKTCEHMTQAIVVEGGKR